MCEFNGVVHLFIFFPHPQKIDLLTNSFAFNFVQFMQSGESTNKFLRTLLTTTPSASHISDFRQQRRSDSRADKSSTFPGYDLEYVTLSPRKRRHQAYSQLIRGLLEKTRERLETIRDVVKEEKQLRFHLRTDEHENDAAKLYSVDDEVSIFEFTNPDGNDDENGNDDVSHFSPIPSTYTSAVPRKYFSSLLSAIGFNRVMSSSANTSDSMTKNQNVQENGSGDGIFATYLFNPVLGIWDSARKKFNFNLNGRNGDAANVNNATDAHDDNSDELQLTILYTDSDTVRGSASGNAKNTEYNGNGNDNINQLPLLLPLLSAESSYNNDTKIENMPSSNNDITKLNSTHNNISVDGSRMHNNNKRNAPSSNIERAAHAFQNAFFKYSNYMPTTSTSSNNTSTSTHDATATNVHGQVLGPSNKLKYVHNAVGTDGDGLLANFLDDTPSNIQIVASEKSKMNGTVTATTTTTTSSAAANGNDKHPNSKRQSLESAGILVLEMFGTVIGLTWGAFSHLQSYFNNNRNNGTMT